MNSFKLYVYGLVVRFLPETRCFNFKAKLLRWSGAQIGHNVRVCSSTRILGVGALYIGDDVWVGPESFIMSGEGSSVRIGNCVDIAPCVYISTGSHDIDTKGAHVAGAGWNKTIVIGDGSWICAGAKIFPGVDIGCKSVIAAGAVVLNSVPRSVVAGGVPAKILRNLEG